MASLSKYSFLYKYRWFFFCVVLTTFLIPICILVGRSSIKSYKREYMIAFLICESFMIIVFCMLHLLLFYVFFESILFPMLCEVEHLIFAT
jgi:NADH-ubiquinone oxidoreductase chain 4